MFENNPENNPDKRTKRKIVEEDVEPLIDAAFKICQAKGITFLTIAHAPEKTGDMNCLEYHNQAERSSDLPDHVGFFIGILRGSAVPVSLGKVHGKTPTQNFVPEKDQPASIAELMEKLRKGKKD